MTSLLKVFPIILFEEWLMLPVSHSDIFVTAFFRAIRMLAARSSTLP